MDRRVVWLAERGEDLLRRCGELSGSHQVHRTILNEQSRQAETGDVFAWRLQMSMSDRRNGFGLADTEFARLWENGGSNEHPLQRPFRSRLSSQHGEHQRGQSKNTGKASRP